MWKHQSFGETLCIGCGVIRTMKVDALDEAMGTFLVSHKRYDPVVSVHRRFRSQLVQTNENHQQVVKDFLHQPKKTQLRMGWVCTRRTKMVGQCSVRFCSKSTWRGRFADPEWTCAGHSPLAIVRPDCNRIGQMFPKYW
jgi:hypothetical protein